MPPATRPRVKNQAATHPVPQTKEECDAVIARIGQLQRQRTMLHAANDELMAQIDRRNKQDLEPIEKEMQVIAKGVQVWCEANRHLITREGEVKHAQFPAGVVRWRMRPPKVVVRGVDALIALFKERGLTRLVRTKEEINKEAILADPQSIRGIGGVNIEQGEDFVIEPFETKIEEVL